ncbi:MAG: hypothetical protein GX028_04345, partial [Clostridiaceae bacterium]|nr:hypothetical protein [Clostridiaceae bacterium]
MFSSISDSMSTRSYKKNVMKRRLWALIVMFTMVLTLIPAAPILADSSQINYTDRYWYTGGGVNGTGISGGTTTRKFNMTSDFIAFCVDYNTGISQSVPYVKVSLDHDASVAMFNNTNANPDKIRAILTYAWDKTNTDEIAAIQDAQWNEMHNISLPTSANANITSIYNYLKNDLQPISASSINENVFTLTA